jgi:hypothetical protein
MSAHVVRKAGTRRPPIDARTGKPLPPPETLAQAQRATARGEQLRALGLDPLCAGRLAFAAQEGAAPVSPPCATCLPLVEALGGSHANGWRTSGTALTKPPVRTQHIPGVPGSPYSCVQPSSEVSAA